MLTPRVLTTMVLVSSLTACASGGQITVRSARIVEERLDDQSLRAEAILQIDFTTTFNFGAHGEPIGFLVVCGAPRDLSGRPAGYDFGLNYAEPMVVDASNVARQVFTVRYGRGSYERFFSVTPALEAPADGNWSLQFEDPVKANGLCFYVGTSGNLGDSPSSPDVRIDEMLQGGPSAK